LNDALNLESELQQQHDLLLGECRVERRQILDQWDHSDEELISKYENFTTQTQRQKHHDLAALRRNRKHAIEEEEKSFDKRKNEIAQRYASEKPKPSALQSRNDETLRALLSTITSIVQNADNLALQRLGKKRFAELTQDDAGTRIEKTLEAKNANADQPVDFMTRCDHLKDLHAQVTEQFVSLKAGWAVRFSESFFVIAVGLLAAAVWCFAIYQTNLQPLALWMLGAIPAGILIAFAVQAVAGIPVRRMTRSVYPNIVLLETDARLACEEGHRANATLAAQQLEKLRYNPPILLNF
jgi:predicted RND superfamily exporter protein